MPHCVGAFRLPQFVDPVCVTACLRQCNLCLVLLFCKTALDLSSRLTFSANICAAHPEGGCPIKCSEHRKDYSMIIV